MRLLLFTGKGGAGTTTMARATAVHAVRCGIKTLLVGLDDTPPTGLPAGLLLEPGLCVAAADVRSRAQRSWQGLLDGLPGVLDLLGVAAVPADQLTVLPGVADLLVLLELRDLVAGGPWDLVVVDAGPAPRLLGLLGLPEGLSRYLDHALPVESRVRRAIEQRSRDYLVDGAEALRAELAPVRDLLGAPTTSVRLVLDPTPSGLVQARRTWTALALHGVPVDGVLANRLVPDGGDDPWRAAWAASQARVLRDAVRDFGSVQVRPVAHLAAEPDDSGALAELGCAVYGAGATAPLLDPPPVTVGVTREGEDFLWALPLPMAVRHQVGLARDGDDLVIELPGERRVLALPSALRRCVVREARLTGGVLQVRFRPDPDLWPPG